MEIGNDAKRRRNPGAGRHYAAASNGNCAGKTSQLETKSVSPQTAYARRDGKIIGRAGAGRNICAPRLAAG